MKHQISVGCGSAYADDWLGPGIDLANSGRVDYMIFDCLAERTIALAHVRKMADPSSGQDQRIDQVVKSFGPFMSAGGRIIGSFGGANPEAGARQVADAFQRNGLRGQRVGAIFGDNVLEEIVKMDVDLPEMGVRLSQLDYPIVAANAYVGAEEIIALLEEDCAFILGGRIADPSPYVAAICHELGWKLDDWEAVGCATLAGHLLECGVQGSGGNFVDPPYRRLANVFNLGAPMAVIDQNRDIVVSKLDTTGGAINEQVVKSQLLYEIHDPAAYLTPDVTADFSNVRVVESGRDEVRVTGASGSPAPETLKVLVGLDMGWKVVGEASIGAAGCVDRAKYAAGVLRERLTPFETGITEMRIDLHGVSALFGEALTSNSEPSEVRLRFAARCADLDTAKRVAREIEFLYFAVAGAGGISHSIVPAIGVTPAAIPRASVDLSTEVISA